MEVNIIRSDRKSVGIQINADLTVTVRAPMRISKREIDKILAEKEDWIVKHIELQRIRNSEWEAKAHTRLSMDEIRELGAKALEHIPKRVRYYAPLIGVSYGRITIRNQRTRWGSCSRNGNLNFNCLLMLMPEEIIDYVVVHELCHRKEMNHSERFWSEVEKVMPDYETHKKWLKEHGTSIMGEMTGE